MCFSDSHCYGLRWDSEQPKSLVSRRLVTAALGVRGDSGGEKDGTVTWLLVGLQSPGTGERERESCESLTEKASRLLESHKAAEKPLMPCNSGHTPRVKPEAPVTECCGACVLNRV